MKFRTSYTPNEVLLEINDEASATAPDMAVDIKELFRRFNAGSLADLEKPFTGQTDDITAVISRDMDVFEAYEQDKKYRNFLSEYLKAKEAEQLEQRERDELARLKAKYQADEVAEATSTQTSEARQ